MKLRCIMALWIMCLAFSLSSCTYQISTSVSPAETIYSVYDKIPGKVVLVLDENIKSLYKDLKAETHPCSAHTFQLDMEDTLALSVKQTTESIFEKVVELDEIPTTEDLQKLNSSGVIYVKMRSFDPEIYFHTKTTSTCISTFDVFMKGLNDEKLIISRVAGYWEVDGPGLTNCGKGVTLLKDAIEGSIRDAMEKYAAMLANSERVRSYFYFNQLEPDEPGAPL